MNKILLTAALFSVMGMATVEAEPVNPDSTGFVFKDIKTVKDTPVKDQNKSGTCWSFSSVAFMEDEILRKSGKEVDLSEMFVVRNCYADKADMFVRMYGNANFGSGGSALDVPYVWSAYGIVPEEAYPGILYGEEKHDHAELDAILNAYVRSVVKKPGKRITTAWKNGFNGVLDAYLGELPESFVYEGKTYTPRSFADALGLDMKDYVAVSSFTHHPFYQEFILEVPDNWLFARVHNVPMEEMKAIVDNAIEKGYPVAWAADVSEGGFKWYEGYAVMPQEKDQASMDGTELSRWVKLSDKDREKDKYDIKGPTPEIEVTQELRQEMFDRQETTDDHGMVIVGIAEDQNGTRYYKVKNSWDTNQIYDGYFYVSEPFFLAKTIDILVHRDAIPNQIAKKMPL